MEQTLTIVNRVHVPMRRQPVRRGVPWPRGAVMGGTALTARDESGQAIPLATRVLNRWPDGSVQWSLVDLALDLDPSATRKVSVSAGAAAATPPPAGAVTVTMREHGIELSNDMTRLTVRTGPGTSLVENWSAGGFDICLIDTTGATYSAAAAKQRQVTVEESSPLRATVRIDGRHEADDGRTLLDFYLRFTLFAGRPDVQVTYHYHNLEAAEPGIELRRMWMSLTTPLPGDAERAIVHSHRGRDMLTTPYRLRDDLELCAANNQDLANYAQTHQGAGITGGGPGRVFIRQPQLLRDDPMLRPWFLRRVVDFKFQSADDPAARTWSYLGLIGHDVSLLTAGGNMIGLHPKSLAVRRDSVTGRATVDYHVWPSWAGTMDITQGEGRTLDFFVATLSGEVDDTALIEQYFSWEFSGLYDHWSAQPSVDVSLDIDHVRACRVFQVDKLPRYDPVEHFALERKVQAQWTPDDPVPANGHWHWGDVFYGWGIGGNNEEMAGHVRFQEYLRTGRPRCFDHGLAQARHSADVDICARSADPYQHGGMCAHGPRHNHCAAYPSHMWFTELWFAYALTGDEEYRRAALRVCDNLVFWINDPKGFSIVSNDGREAGQPLINLAWAYGFAPEQRYLDAMGKIVSEAFMARSARHGTLVYMKPREDLPLLRFPSYGEWAAWEGLFYTWEVTGDEKLRQYLLKELDSRLTEERLATAGIFRNTDFNVAAYAYYLSGDEQWLQRVRRPFRAAFRAANWPIGYLKTMFFIELALRAGIVSDDDVLVS